MIKTLFLICGLACALNAGMASVPTVSAETDTQTLYGASEFLGGMELDTVTQNVSYSTYTVDEYENPYKAPTFSSGYSNGCVVDAGGKALVYYDRLYDDLVPDYKHRYLFGKFTYGQQSSGVDNMYADLYDKMKTSSTGTTISNFKSGMNEYAISKGHSITLTQATGGYNNTNIDYIKSQLEQEKVAVIFLDTFCLTDVDNIKYSGNSVSITYYRYQGAHAMIIYGYKDYNYYNESGSLVYRDTLFYASTGIVSASTALTSISHYSTVDDVYIVDVN